VSALTPHSGPRAQADPPFDAPKRSLEQRPVFYLLYILFYFTPWFFVTPTTADLVIGISAAVTFAAVYLYAMARSTAWALGGAAFALALALGLTPLIGMSGTFGIYAVALCSSIRPGRKALYFMGGALAIYLFGSLFLTYGPPNIPISPFEITITGFISVMAGLASWSGFNTTERFDLRERRLRLDAELAAARERERIARDLHDVLGHTLTTIAVKSDLAARLLGADDAAARREIEEIRDASRATLKEVRAAVAGMHRTTIDIELDRARSALDSAGIALTVIGETAALPSQQGSALGLALREAVTNVLRHSGAKSVTVTLTPTPQNYEITVEDDGGASAPTPGGGLTGMRGRLETLGGALDIGRGALGVRLTMRLPLNTVLEGA
jgi:two-component system sensor histidine kinase DesK